jgi:fibronectin-binding autotransporter adhesin
MCQSLEGRDVPATFSVSNVNDSGNGSLRAAIAAANSNSGSDTISFGVTGTITLTTGELPITEALTLIGPGASNLTISGGNTSRVLNVNLAAGSTVAASGLTISNGNTATPGGGIAVAGGILSLTNCVISGNSASDKGGGIYMAPGAGDLSLDGCTVSNNTAAVNGGGIDSRGGTRQVTIRNSTIANNAAQSRVGISMISGIQSLLLENCTVVGNHSSLGHGGGLSFSATVGAGGAIVRNSTISGNSATQGGGGIQFFAAGGTMMVQNCTITANTASGIGDGFGGGIECGGYGPIDLQSDIVSGNTDATGNAPDIGSNLTVTANFSAIGSSAGFKLSGANNLPFGVDLKLGPLANNGGPTQTHALLNGSPAIDAGSYPANLTTDQRGAGFARVGSKAADIGAFEVQPITTTWIGGAAGAVNVWENPANWSNGVPGQLDTAVFQSSGTKNFAPVQVVATTIRSLSIDASWGGSITSNAAFTMTGPSTWASGTISVSASGMTNSGTMTLNNFANITLTGGGTFTNSGNIIESGAGNLQLAGNTTLDNIVGGVYDLEAASTFTSTGSSIFTSEGTLRRSVGSGGLTLQSNFTISGTIDIQTGSLTLASTGTGTVSNAMLSVVPSTYLFLDSGGTTYVSGLITSTGGGGILQSNGTLQLAGDTTFNFAPSMHSWLAGNINLNGKTLTNAAGSIFSLSNGPTVALLGGGTFSNRGTIYQSNSGSLQITGAGTTLDTPAGGLFVSQTDAPISYFGTSGMFTNEGTYQRAAVSGSTSSTLGCNFSLSGVIDVQSSQLILGGAGVTGTVSGATIKVASGATLDLTGGQTTNVTGILTGSGGGTISHANGTVQLSGDTTFNFPAPMYQWTGGTLNLNGKALTNAGVMTLNNAGAVTLSGGKLTNSGTVNQTGAANLNINGSTTIFDNAVGGVFDLKSDTQINYSTTAGTFTNEGALRRSAGSATASLVCNFTVGGVIDVQAGTLALAPNATTGTVSSATATVAKNASLNLTGGQTVNYTGTLTGSGAGSVALSSGTLNVPTTATFNFTDGLFQWTAGTINIVGTLTNAASGFMTLSNAGPVVITGGGTLSNAGTIRQTGGGNLQINSTGTTLDTPAGGVFDLQSDAQITFSGTAGKFTNEGTLRRSPGVGTTAGTLAGNFTLSGTIDVQSTTLKLAPSGATGTIAGGTIKVVPGATLDLTGNQTTNVSGIFTGSGGGKILHGGGTVQLSGDASFNFPSPMYQWTGGTLNLNGKTLTNAAGGFMTLNNSSGITLSGGSTLSNAGTMQQTGLSNLSLNGSGTMLDTVAGGVYDLQSNTQINCVGTTGVFTVEGTLRRSVGTGTATLASNFNLAGTVDVQTGTLTFFPNGVAGSITGGSLNVSTGATLNLTNGATTVVSGAISGSGSGKLVLNSGTISVPTMATLSFADPLFQVTGGTFSVTGTLTNAASGFITLANVGSTGLTGGGKLSNLGAIRQTGAGGLAIYSAGTTLDNAVGGLYDVQSNSQITYITSTPGTFTNSGTLRRSVGAGTASIVCNFTLGGTVDVQTGTFGFAPSGSTGIVNGANLQVSAGAKLLPTGGFSNVNLAGSITGGGVGAIVMNGGTLSVPADATIAFPDNLFQWAGGSLSVAPTATLTNAASGYLIMSTIPGGSLTGGGTLANSGSIRLSGNGGLLISGAGTTLVNAATGLFDLQGTGGVSYSATKGAIINRGLFRKRNDSGTATVDCNYSNDGGTIEIQSGNLDLPGTIALNKGTLEGPGILYAPVINADGTVRRGSSPGKLTVFGDYTQSGTGNDIVQLNGPNAGSDYDQVAVVGKVTLGGTLSPSMGYLTNPNDTFVIIDNDGNADPVIGTFAGLPEGATVPITNGTAVISYKGGDGNDVTLKIVTPPTIFSAPQVSEVKVNGGAAQRSMVTSLSMRFDQVVSLPANPAAAFQLKRQSDAAPVTLAASVDNTGPGTIVTLTFTGGAVNGTSLADGRYTLTVLANQVTGAFGALDGDDNGTGGDDYTLVGNPSTNKLFRFFGDIDGDGAVATNDFVLFRQSFNGVNDIFDFDDDGFVSTSDFVQFRSRFNTSI